MDISKFLVKVSDENKCIKKLKIYKNSLSSHFQYKNIQATKKDVLLALEQYRALTYRNDNYVFNDGSSKELFCMTGTIPVVYKSKFHFLIKSNSMNHRL